MSSSQKSLLCLLAAVTLAAPSRSSLAGSFDIERIRKDIYVLASDSLEGRRVGASGEAKAVRYIVAEFRKLGLSPVNDGSFEQPFEFIAGAKMGTGNQLSIDSRTLNPDSDFVPLDNSRPGPFTFDSLVLVGYGIENDSMNYHDYKDKVVDGRAVLISRFAPDGDDPHGPYGNNSSLDAKIAEAVKRKVAGIFFYTPSDQDDELPKSFGIHNVVPKDIPIVFLRHAGVNAVSTSPEELSKHRFAGVVDITVEKDTGTNVGAVLVGGKPSSQERIVVVGGHFDHLGWGGQGSGSLYAGSEPQIHNGADDNASGAAGVLELARYYTDRRSDLNCTMVFMTFSGEEAGLLGSNYFVKNPPIDLAKVDFMVNMDMIGRLDTAKGLTVLGVGTSPPLKEYFEKPASAPFKIVTSESGVAPSDNTAFYNAGMPVMFFFTGSHTDYHKPSDDADKINYEGEVAVLRYVAASIDHFAAQPEKLAFTKTKSDAPGASPRFTVTLGVMPDYASQVKGLRIDGVTDGRPASKAGILAGDVIVRLGDYQIDDIQGYMVALSKYRKGDSAEVVVERGGQRLTMTVTF